MVSLTEGKPLVNYLKFCFPVLITNLVNQSYIYIDTAIIGKTLGLTALAAVGITGNILFFTNSLLSGFAMGVTIVTAKLIGQKMYTEHKKSVAVSIFIESIISLLVTFLGVFLSRPLLKALGTSSEILDLAVLYLIITFSGSIFAGLSQVISNLWVASGDSKTSMVFNILCGFIKVVFAYILVVILNLGITGAALSSVFSNLLDLILKLIYSIMKKPEFRLTGNDLKVSRRFVFSHFSVGLALSIQGSVTGVGKIIFQCALNAFSPAHIAGYTAAVKIENLCHTVNTSIAQTAATFISQNMGALAYDRVRYTIKSSLLINIVFSIVFGGICILSANQLNGIFINKQDFDSVLPLAVFYLRITAFAFPFAALLNSVRNVLQGLGMSFATIIGGVTELLVNVFVAVFLKDIMGFTGIALACPISWILASIPLCAIMYNKIFKEKRNANSMETC